MDISVLVYKLHQKAVTERHDLQVLLYLNLSTQSRHFSLVVNDPRYLSIRYSLSSLNLEYEFSGPTLPSHTFGW